MDYVVGSVAALVTGNVTPSRPRILKRALTPTKHQASPNVTPKSEFVDDRSIFLSPSMQKKKAIVKKSPKRIFQNPDLETTDNGDGNLSLTSPKADKVKKHLKDDLDSNVGSNKEGKNKDKNQKELVLAVEESSVNVQSSNESTPKKKKKKTKSVTEDSEALTTEIPQRSVSENSISVFKNTKKMKQRRQSVIDDESNKENGNSELQNDPTISKNKGSPTKQKYETSNTESVETNQKKKNKKRKKKSKQQNVEKLESTENVEVEVNTESNANNIVTKKKNRKRKKSKTEENIPEPMETDQLASENEEVDAKTTHNKKSKTKVNPNAITDKESDSEHESDNEIESENEEINKSVFASEPMADESTDEDEEKEQPHKTKAENKEVKEKREKHTEDKIKRTLFVGNVPFSAKCKKEIKKIFNKHGQIETIRIRTVPLKDGRYTPKLALIKNELHPERTTVNVYIKYADEASADKALAENNTVLNNHHLRVSRSSHTGAEHDPKCSVFVGNLPFAVEDEVLRQKFENCGEIESVRIIRDKKTNAGKGFGYVNFASKDAVELALALTEEDLTIKNRIIRVKRCTQLTNKQKQSADKSVVKKSFNQRPNAGNQRVQSGHRGNQGFQRGNQGGQRGNQGGQRWNQGGQRGNQIGQKNGIKDEEGRDGAHRRIMHKRKNQDAGGADGPPNKRQKDINQPNKEKKSRKEFVGMTAEKKKKRKFDKGQKKKKALSEILTK